MRLQYIAIKELDPKGNARTDYCDKNRLEYALLFLFKKEMMYKNYN